MAEKSLSDGEWKKFAKGRNLKDAPFLKALGMLDGAKDAAARLVALTEVDKQAELLRKANKGVKEIAGYLDDVDKAVARERKLAESDAAKAKAASAKVEAAEDDEDSPALLTTQMVPLLRMVRKGEVMHALVGIGGKECVVLLARRTISPARRKLLQDWLGQSGGVKWAVGECIWEENCHTFVLQTQAAGLAKKLRAALLKQTEMRWKVRVRGEDPDDIDDDGEPLEAQSAEGETQEQAHHEQQEARVAEPDPQQAAFEARLAAVTPRVLQALQDQHEAATKIRAVSEFAREKGEGGNFKSALAALDQLEKLLAAPAEAAAPAGSGQVDYAKCRLAWEAAKKKVHAELQKLEAAILDAYQGQPGYDEIVAKVRKVDTVLTDFADGLSDTLDQAFNEADAAERRRQHEKAATVIRKYLDRAANDPFIHELESNPFVPITAKATLVSTLGTLAKLIVA